MADKKISQLTAATTPLAGSEELPLVQSGETRRVTSDNLTVKNVRSNATTGVLQVAGPTAGTTRTMTVPDANFTAARTDAGQTFTGIQITESEFRSQRPGVATQYISQTADGGGTFLNIINTANTAKMSYQVVRTTSAGTTYPLELDSNDALKVKLGNLVIESENLVIGTSGKGIDFSATASGSGTMTSELLADYEEGTWTPDLTFATAGDLALTYGVRLGTYTRVGRLVTVAFRITTTAFTWTTASGALQLGGLPFASRTLTDMRVFNPISFNGATKANYTTLAAQLNSASSTIVFTWSGQGQGQTGANAADFPTGGTPFLAGFLSYEAA